MATVPSTSQPEGVSNSMAPQEPTVNLQIVSPSVGVDRPLHFPSLPAATTIKQLKDLIRQEISYRPAGEKQRLIHRGHALLNENITLLEVFGKEALQLPDKQTIHLVIRDEMDRQNSTTPTPTQAQPPMAAAPPTVPQRQLPQPPHPFHLPHPHNSPFAAAPHAQMQFPQAVNVAQGQNQPPFYANHMPPHVAVLQQRHQQMGQWLNQVQREAMTNLVHQNQRGRAQIGMHGIGDQVGHNGHPAAFDRERASSATGPRAAGTSPGLTAHDVHHVLHRADAGHAAQNVMTSAVRRSASSASLQNRTSHQPGATTPVLPGVASGTGSRMVTPEPAGSSTSRVAHSSTTAPSQGQTPQEVYIVSSPEGPRALLFNHAASESYYTPRHRIQASPFPPGFGGFPGPNMMPGMPPFSFNFPQQHQQTHLNGQMHQPRETGPNAPLDQAAQPNQQAGAGIAQPANPGPAVDGLPPIVIQLWPHLWLLLRLSIFVWLFTSPQAPWSRWLTVIGMAICLFIYSSGLINGFANRAWQPLGQHVQNLLPRLEQQHPQPQAAAEPVQPGQPQGAGMANTDRVPDPAQMAARLLAERRARGSWLLTQYRRVERAGLLFMASIAPGLAERHIATLEAEVRAERERVEAEQRAETERREAEAAAAAAAAAEAEAAGADAGAMSGTEETRDISADTGTNEAPGQDSELVQTAA